MGGHKDSNYPGHRFKQIFTAFLMVPHFSLTSAIFCTEKNYFFESAKVTGFLEFYYTCTDTERTKKSV